MPTKEGLPSLLVTQDESIPKDRLFIGKTKTPIDEGETLYAENADIVLDDDASLGSRFFGWGIIRSIAEAGKQAILVTSRGKDIIFPEGQDEG
jgi:hypothetical protein